ncbi:sigma-54-dependent transcriptional regulator [Candidatus Magnetominusculus xianensis]|uniref:Sigma-54-dependent Fis family transcriptional regulator n=1 Tax=Candidatus Magnetominusculus xianensis TaxID=1748249 RepID=A0ABR5SJ99_9BACT|nr:sigma-54 dependent transcriptional regulator [Candidatus Magnetominusculus xianensis]KWT94222.1 sigma-54-dependent Fis family transcriptional regulator [Candidatus Magnetominusculus xianensis]MBF0402997.1 sigma-54-dependent Fis family transcriptional regulator [Nitrospirota bacterium]
MAVVVVIDDEPLQRGILKAILEDEGYEVFAAESAEKGLEIIRDKNADVVLTDLNMSGMTGIQMLEYLPDEPSRPAVIVITAYGTINSAVEAMKKGAFDYLIKPLDKDVITLVVGKAAERMSLLKENIRLHKELYDKFNMEGIIGRSKRMTEVIDIVKKITAHAVTVLVYGESGTGKELIARAIHYNSPRKNAPFNAINCAAIPDNLIESELFGYELGAFTGATQRKAGIIESTNNGTLFLDEIGDLPLLTQTKLLRVLQDKEVRRLGGKETMKVNVRFIAATNKDLESEIENGKFREDLYYRLKVVTVTLPPLTERKEDIPSLVNFFISKYNTEFGSHITGIDHRALKLLTDYHWPGNIRQLGSVIERAVLMADTTVISPDDIKSELKQPAACGIMDIEIPEEGIVFEELEKKLLKQAMQKANNVAAKAARLLGMSYKTFWYRLEKFGINIPGGTRPPRDTPNKDTS